MILPFTLKEYDYWRDTLEIITKWHNEPIMPEPVKQVIREELDRMPPAIRKTYIAEKYLGKCL